MTEKPLRAERRRPRLLVRARPRARRCGRGTPAHLRPRTAALLLCLLVAAAVSAQPQKPLDAAELRLALDKLLVTGSALYIAAHPDDENTALLAWLANERRVRTAYLSVTRGEGGQNLIGSEKGDLLGVIRTQELLAARRIDGAEQFFTCAVDFGYSKTSEETLRIWGRDKILSDVVWVIRSFRPDVIITRFPGTGEGGHGHHTASAILAEEAFHASADPNRFPEQLTLAKPWQAKRLLWNSFQRRSSTPAEVPPNSIAVDLGTYSALLGRSYTEIAADSRSMHKSQGFGSAERRGTLLNRLQHVAGDPAKNDLFEGVDLSWRRFSGGERIEAILQRAVREFDPNQPHHVVPLLVQAFDQIRSLPEEPLIAAKRRDLLEAIRAAAGLWIEAIANVPSAPPGGEMKIATTIVNRSPLSIRLHGSASPIGKVALESPAVLASNEPRTVELWGRVPPDSPYSHPYWLNGPVPQQLVGLPENPPALPATFDLAIEGVRLQYTVPALFRSVDRVKGELYRPFSVAPPLTIELPEELHLFKAPSAKQVTLKVKRTAGNTEPAEGILRLELPQGWKANPASKPFRLDKDNNPLALSFDITPPAGRSVGELKPRIEALDLAETRIEYDHIPTQILFPRAAARVIRVDAATRGQRIGYVMGPGDDVPEALRQLGYQVTLLSDADLEQAELSEYDAVVTGVRAYNTRQTLRETQERLLKYVEDGGTLVVQYNTMDESLPQRLGPYPLKLSRDRVTVEEAPVTLVAPDHPLLTNPNRITDADFEGWVQERGLYFPGEWDSRYQTVLATADPGEAEKRSAILYARYGKGIYIYTPLAWFRQLPAGIPGAYRLFANLVSACATCHPERSEAE